MARGIVQFNAGLTVVKGSQFQEDFNDATKRSAADGLERVPYSRGIFSEYPSSTPKWLGRLGDRQVDFKETMARMFILLDAKERARFLASVNTHGHGMQDQGETKTLASVLAGSGRSGGRGYIDFLLQQADHQFREKAQIVETLADNYVIYYFGQEAVPFTYSGTVFNTFEDDQAINMLRIYRDMIRGTQLARRRKLLRLRYNGMIVAGSVMGLTLGLTADPETTMSFSFQLMPKSIQLLPNPDFGVAMVHDMVEVDPFFLQTEDPPTNVTGGRPVAAPADASTTAEQVAAILAENGQSVEVDINGQTLVSEDEAGTG